MTPARSAFPAQLFWKAGRPKKRWNMTAAADVPVAAAVEIVAAGVETGVETVVDVEVAAAIEANATPMAATAATQIADKTEKRFKSST